MHNNSQVTSYRSLITVIIIAKNEEKKIKDCLESVSWADEIVVVDSGSTDKTVDIVKEYKAKIVKVRGGNYSYWRNRGAKKAKGDWILYVDADERVKPSLRDEIIQLTNNSTNQFSVFAIPRRNFILGKEMRHGGWSPDFVVRLFRKDSFRGYFGVLHEQPKVEGEIGKLKESFIHYTGDTVSAMVAKSNVWSGVEARLMYKAGHPKMNLIRFLKAPLAEVIDRLILKKGFMDAGEGFVVNLFQGWHKIIVYAKLWEMQQRKQFEK